jgi:hypothetical protein
MFEYRTKLIFVRGLMLTACLALVAGCKAEVVPATPQQPPVAQAPAAPTGLVAVPGNAQANLSWSASGGAATYKVKRSTSSGGPYTLVAAPATPTYSDTSLSNGTMYYYVVAAASSGGDSADSAPASVTPVGPVSNPSGPPPVPAGLTAVSGVAEASLSWSASNGATGYSVKRSTSSGGPYTQVAIPSLTSYSDMAVTNGTTYYYVVSARNAAGESGNSSQVSASPVAAGTLPNVTCNNLDAVGVWKNITPPIYDSTYRAAAFVVDRNTGIVYLGTDSFNDGNSKGVQRTVNCGETWEHVSTGANSKAIDGGRQWTFAINHLDGRIMYTNTGYYFGPAGLVQMGLWKSVNGGVDWTDVTPKNDGAPGFVGYVSMDPDDPEHLIVTWHGPCNGKNNEFRYDDHVGCFHETKDGGRTWKGHYGTPRWGEQVRAVLLHGSTWLVLADEVQRTSDGGQTYAAVPGGSLSGHSSGLLSRADNGDFYIGATYGIYKSTKASDGQQWTGYSGSWVGEIIDTGTRLYATHMTGPLSSSPSSDGTVWTSVVGGPTQCERARFDPVHKVVYVSCGGAGFWRMKTE